MSLVRRPARGRSRGWILTSLGPAMAVVVALGAAACSGDDGAPGADGEPAPTPTSVPAESVPSETDASEVDTSDTTTGDVTRDPFSYEQVELASRAGITAR